jgi:hypothetical protein
MLTSNARKSVRSGTERLAPQAKTVEFEKSMR